MAVIGGGGAGLMAALFAARAGASTVVLEGSKECGRKILISGGGRCNVLPVESDETDFYTQGSRNVLRRLFRTWPLDEVRAFFERDLEIELEEEEESGKLFPAWQRAKPVRDRLVERVEAEGAELRVPWRVASLDKTDDGYLIASADGSELLAERVIVATGGRSVPKTGSDGFGYELAAGLGHSILDTYPALVPLTTGDSDYTELSGISLPVRWRAFLGDQIVEERERELLFTHEGFSGPAILDASHWAVRDGARLEVAWAAGTQEEWEEHWQSRGRRECARALGDYLPRRLADLVCKRAGIRGETRIGNLNRSHRDKLLKELCATTLPITGNRGFSVAEVTGGGVPLGEVQPSTLESREAAGVYFCGEILDVIGRIGGYNFLWAWITGRLAGESAAKP